MFLLSINMTWWDQYWKYQIWTTDLSNFRLISNLPFTVKILEKTVLLQLQSFLDMSSILDKFQSSFSTNHGPESALLRVLNEILLSVDSEDSVILMLLDYIFTYWQDIDSWHWRLCPICSSAYLWCSPRFHLGPNSVFIKYVTSRFDSNLIKADDTQICLWSTLTGKA